jgi:hypothetical protein
LPDGPKLLAAHTECQILATPFLPPLRQIDQVHEERNEEEG